MDGGRWHWHGDWDGGWDEWQRSGAWRGGWWHANDEPPAAAVADSAPAWPGGVGRTDGRANDEPPAAAVADSWPAGVAPAPNLPPAAVADANAEPARIYDLDYFQGLADVGFTDHYRQHNVALKWFREKGERDHRYEVRFSNDEPELVPEIHHPPGMEYWFDESSEKPWRWQDLVAQLELGHMQRVVCGEDRSRGLVGCRLVRSERYDHKRAHARRETTGEQTAFSVWDFVVDRSDGTCATLHPDYKGSKVTMREGAQVPDREMPRLGPGTSEGPGTYRRFKNKHVDEVLRFDPSRIRPKGSGKGHSGTRA